MESNINFLKPFSWADVNWNALRRLRARFLEFGDSAQTANRDDYWGSHSELASYDFTFAERIGWKWDTVLAELRQRGWTPPSGSVLDWGCGTGVASRRVMSAWPGVFDRLVLTDRSGPARRFAATKAREAFPGVTVEVGGGGDAGLLVVSHVLNELPPNALESLLATAAKATAILWVEPGTHEVSRRLCALRERLLEIGFHAVAPCTHAAACGILAPGNERHWCHHLARVPSEVHTDPGWGKFAQTLDLDLGRVPFSFLVLDRRAESARDFREARVIGEPRMYKGLAKVLSCQADGVHELTQQKRDSGELYKELKKDPGSLYRWEREGDKIVGGERVF
jgi:hypothetical protein